MGRIGLELNAMAPATIGGYVCLFSKSATATLYSETLHT